MQDLQDDKDYQVLVKQAFHGERAAEVKNGNDWKWLNEYIFGALFDEAVMVMRNARTEEERIKAQQMFLSCEKPRKLLESLISQGDAARASLVELQATTLDIKEELNHA